jgi:hypothetical protein
MQAPNIECDQKEEHDSDQKVIRNADRNDLVTKEDKKVTKKAREQQTKENKPKNEKDLKVTRQLIKRTLNKSLPPTETHEIKRKCKPKIRERTKMSG